MYNGFTGGLICANWGAPICRLPARELGPIKGHLCGKWDDSVAPFRVNERRGGVLVIRGSSPRRVAAFPRIYRLIKGRRGAACFDFDVAYTNASNWWSGTTRRRRPERSSPTCTTTKTILKFSKTFGHVFEIVENFLIFFETFLTFPAIFRNVFRNF